ncbi:uncharacterized protein FYW35_011144 isoform 1-T1 [Pterocles gutturalis]
MLATLMTALFFVVRAFGQIGSNLFQEEPLPYLVYQPLPWQIQCVTQSRRTSRDSERGRSSRHNSIYSNSGEKGEYGAGREAALLEYSGKLLVVTVGCTRTAGMAFPPLFALVSTPLPLC